MKIPKFRRGVFAALTVMLCLYLPVSMYAQSGQADVQGIVTDPSGAMVAGAEVTLTNADNGAKRTVKTASDGRYSFPTVAPGRYSITVSAPSFSTQTVDSLAIQLDNHVNQNVTMRLGSQADTVTVTGAVPAVDTTAYDVGGIVDQAQIDNLPIPNRQYLALALLTPGTSQDASRSFYSNVQSGGGLYYYANGFSWDGVSNQQTEQGDPRQNIPEDAVGEFKTFTAQMPADLGWAMGGYTALVTKSGTNKIHGDVFEYFRDTALNADNQFVQATELIQKTGSPPYRRNQFGGSAGGPIFKDKTHYFGAYERTQATTSWTLYEPAGSAAATLYAPLLGTFSAPSHDQLIVGRIDHNLTANQQVFFRVGFEQQLSSANGCGNTTTTGCYDGKFPRKAYVAGHTWEPNARMVNEARFQYAYISYQLGPWNTPPPKSPTDLLDPSYTKNISLSYTFPSFSYGHNYAADGVESRWQVNDSLSIQRGAHSMKVGVDFSYVPYVDGVASNLNGTYTFATDQPFDGTVASAAALSNPRSFSQAAVARVFYLPSTQQAYFFEDSWKALKNLTISAGIRYDRQMGSAFLDTYTPTVSASRPAIPYEGDPHKRGDKNNFGPRLGFSYDPFNKQKDVIRGGYGVFYNFIQTEQVEAEKLNFVACSISLTNGTPSGYVLPYPNPYNGKSVTDYCSTAPANVSILAPDLRNAYMHQFSLGYTRQLGKDLSVSVDGVYDRGLRDYKVYDRNLPAVYANNTVASARPAPLLGQVSQYASTGATEYQGLFVKFTKRYSHRYMYTAAYTLASSHDNNPHGSPVDYNNLQNDWGPSGIDRRHAIVLSGSYMAPWKIMIGGIFSYRGRQPFTMTTTQVTSFTVGGVNDNYGAFPFNPNYNGTAQYVPGTKRGQGNRDINYTAVNLYRSQLNDHTPPNSTISAPYYRSCHPSTAVAPVCLSTNVGPDTFVSNDYLNFDLRVSKTVFQHEAIKLDIIGQAFNLFGRENYTGITTSPVSYTIGQPTGAGTVQIGEVAAKFTF